MICLFVGIISQMLFYPNYLWEMMQWKIAPRVRRVVSSRWSLTWLGGRWVGVGSCYAGSGELPCSSLLCPQTIWLIDSEVFSSPTSEWEVMRIFLWEIVILCCRSYSWVRQGWFSRIWWQRRADSPGSLLWARPFWTLLPAVKNGHLVARSQSTALRNARLLEVRLLDNVWLGCVRVLSGRGLFHRSPRYWCSRSSLCGGHWLPRAVSFLKTSFALDCHLILVQRGIPCLRPASGQRGEQWAWACTAAVRRAPALPCSPFRGESVTLKLGVKSTLIVRCGVWWLLLSNVVLCSSGIMSNMHNSIKWLRETNNGFFSWSSGSKVFSWTKHFWLQARARKGRHGFVTHSLIFCTLWLSVQARRVCN